MAVSRKTKKDTLSTMDFQTHVITKLDELTKTVTANVTETQNIVKRLDTLNGKVAKLQEESNGHSSWISKHDELDKVFAGIEDSKFKEIMNRLDKIDSILAESKQTVITFLMNVDWLKMSKVIGVIIIAIGLIAAGKLDALDRILSFFIG